MRLQKYIAKAGISSRRKAEQYILQGRVKINDKIIKRLGTKVNVDKDIIKVDDKLIVIEEEKIYILLNKPKGYISSLKSDHNDKIVTDLLDSVKERVYPVGRLDKDTTGLLIMTNDGNLAYRLTHPKYEILKSYKALVKGVPNNKKINRFKKGLMIDGRMTSKANIKIISRYNNMSILEISIHEGRNRQIRKMCENIGHPVIELERFAVEGLRLGQLQVGKWRYLTDDEVRYLKSL